MDGRWRVERPARHSPDNLAPGWHTANHRRLGRQHLSFQRRNLQSRHGELEQPGRDERRALAAYGDVAGQRESPARGRLRWRSTRQHRAVRFRRRLGDQRTCAGDDHSGGSRRRRRAMAGGWRTVANQRRGRDQFVRRQSCGVIHDDSGLDHAVGSNPDGGFGGRPHQPGVRHVHAFSRGIASDPESSRRSHRWGGVAGGWRGLSCQRRSADKFIRRPAHGRVQVHCGLVCARQQNRDDRDRRDHQPCGNLLADFRRLAGDPDSFWRSECRRSLASGRRGFASER